MSAERFPATDRHLNKPRISFYDNAVVLKPRVVINAGLNMTTGDLDNFYIYGDYIMQSGNRQILTGMLYGHALNDYNDEDHKYAIYFGGFLRWADAFVPVAKLEFDKVNIGLSYDINISKLKTASQLRRERFRDRRSNWFSITTCRTSK